MLFMLVGQNRTSGFFVHRLLGSVTFHIGFWISFCLFGTNTWNYRSSFFFYNLIKYVIEVVYTDALVYSHNH